MTVGGLALGIIAIFLPPLAVLLRAGCGVYFLLSIVLLFLGWFPAVLFAWFVIIDKPSMRQRRRISQEQRQIQRAQTRSRSIGSARRSVSYGGDGGRRSYSSGRGFVHEGRARNRSRARTRLPEMTEWERRTWTSKPVYSRW